MIIKVKVKPNSKEFKIKKGEVWGISLTKPAKDNKANIELIREMKKRYGRCRIIKGKTKNIKILELSYD